MAQKTLLSFFKKAPVTVSSPQVSVDEPPGKVKEECPNDSPVKQPNKRRRLNPIIDSDEDEPISSVDITKDSSLSSDSKIESKNTEGRHVRSNEKSTSSAEQDNSNNEAGNKDSTSPISKPVNGDVHKNGSGISVDNGEPRVHTTQNICPDFIPKRKTARKQMRGGLKPKAKSPNEPSSPIDSKSESVAESNSDDKDKVSDQEVSTNNEEKMEVDKSSGESDGENKNSNCSQELNKDYSDSCEADTVKKSSPKTSKKVLKPASKKKEKSAKSKVSSKSAKGRQQRISSEDDESDADKDSSSEHCLTGANSIDKEDSKKNSDPQSSKEKPAIHPFFASKKNDNGSSEGSEEGPAKSSSSGSSSSKEESKTSLSSSSENGYNPSKSPYHPIDDACWKHGEKVPYHALAKTLELIENISGRLQMIEILSNFLRSVIVLTPDDLIHCVYLCLNRLAPEYEGIELGVGESLLMRAVAQATGRTVDKIKAEVAVKGDLGLVAESSRGNQRVMFAPPKLTVSSVFAKFKEIAKMSGNSAMAKKTDKIQVLLVACRDCEAKYIIRSLSGKLRIGLAEQSVLAGLARAAVMTPPNQSYPPEIIDKSSKMSTEKFKTYLTAQTLILKTTYCECPNYDLIIPVLLKEGIDALPEHCQLTPGCPLKPMLAQPTNGIAEVLNRFDKNEFTCEFKYDGERAQIHMTEKGEVKIFSRNQEDNTSKYPDVISRISSVLHESTKTFILDSEAVAWDKETKQILPFQVLSTRKRKDAVESDIVVQVCIMAFDLLYLNGESLVKKTLKERRALLHSSFVEVPNEFMFVNYKDGNSAETMQEYLDESIKGNCEGLMVKALTVDASYEIAKRSHNWLKLKKDYLKGIGDTLDLVVIGGYHGKGKRAGTYGGFLLACYDEENEEFQSICKLGTGFSEEELETHTKFLKEHVINEPRSYYRYDSSLEPDEWFDAVQIWEIKCADLSISPVHKAAQGIVDPEKGISLRFPRFLRIREDKTKPEDCTSASQIAGMYQNQEQVQNMTKNKNVKTDEDYY